MLSQIKINKGPDEGCSPVHGGFGRHSLEDFKQRWIVSRLPDTGDLLFAKVGYLIWVVIVGAAAVVELLFVGSIALKILHIW